MDELTTAEVKRLSQVHRTAEQTIRDAWEEWYYPQCLLDNETPTLEGFKDQVADILTNYKTVV